MGKIKKRKHITLVPAYVIVAVSFLLVAMFIADFEREYIEDVQYRVASKYVSEVEVFNENKVWDMQGKVYQMCQEDSNRMRRLDFFYYIFPHMAYICSTILASFVYYRLRLKKPLRILENAAERITKNDLEFTVYYEKDDELGQLCKSFEKMRSCLDENNRQTWRQMEERKRLNASFSHDLRTPLTVLEGHLDMLRNYALSEALEKEDIAEIYEVMDVQLKRLVQYVSGISELQRMEDIPITPKKISTEELKRVLFNIAEVICCEKKLVFDCELSGNDVSLDLEIILRVFENLLSNAVRYADTEVSVQCRIEENELIIAVSDDGKGFDADALKSATDPFYTTEKKSDGVHFGLGLNIAKILCQRHRGSISLKNKENKGALIVVRFCVF